MSIPFADIVRLRLDVEGMRHSVVHALAVHHDGIQKQVEEEISRAFADGYIEEILRASVRRHLDAAVDGAVKHAMSSWVRGSHSVQSAIQEAITIALESSDKK